jgi:zinc protease
MMTLGVLSAYLLSATPLSVPFERYTLPNGMTVILHQDKALPSVTVNIWYNVGSADEAKGRTGFAHLFEHLMFMGTKVAPNGAFDTVMEQAGGVNNATTSNDRTNYFETGPSNLLETFLFLESDRLAHLAEDMTKAKVDLQRDVVKNERRQSYENRPYGMAELIVVDRLFPVGHPYHHPVIGSHADLSAASVDDVKSFFRKHYVPANASLVVAGHFEVSEAKRLIEKYFAPLPRVEAPVRVNIPTVTLSKPIRVVQPDAVQQERVVLAYLAPAGNARGSAEIELLSTILADGKASRLVKSLVVDQQLAESVEARYEALRGQGIFEIVATAQGAHTAAELEKALEAEIAKLLREGPNAAELSRAKAKSVTSTLNALENIDVRANALNEAELRLGDPGDVERATLARIESVTPSSVLDQSLTLFSKPRLTLTFVAKDKKGAAR